MSFPKLTLQAIGISRSKTDSTYEGIHGYKIKTLIYRNDELVQTTNRRIPTSYSVYHSSKK